MTHGMPYQPLDFKADRLPAEPAILWFLLRCAAIYLHSMEREMTRIDGLDPHTRATAEQSEWILRAVVARLSSAMTEETFEKGRDIVLNHLLDITGVMQRPNPGQG